MVAEVHHEREEDDCIKLFGKRGERERIGSIRPWREEEIFIVVLCFPLGNRKKARSAGMQSVWSRGI